MQSVAYRAPDKGCGPGEAGYVLGAATMELLILLRTAVIALGSYNKGKTILLALLVSYTPLGR